MQLEALLGLLDLQHYLSCISNKSMANHHSFSRALLYGGMRESSQKEVEFPNAPLKAFKLLLTYIYTGRLSLGGLREDTVLDILELSHQYGFELLQAAICRYLKEILSVRNVCAIYDKAHLYHLQQLSQTACLFIDRHAAAILRSDAFLQLSTGALKEMLSRNSLCVKEVDVFEGVRRWYVDKTGSVPSEAMSEVLEQVRLPLMDTSDLLGVVRRSKLFHPDCLLDAIKTKKECKDVDLNYRGQLVIEKNVATMEHGAKVLTGEPRHELLEPKTLRSYDADRGFTRHSIDDENGITVELGDMFIINHIILLLWDKDSRSYSYYVEVSRNQKDWCRVIDHSTFLCRSSQKLYFEPRVVRYIRVVGTHNALNNVFHLVSFKALFTEKPFRLSQGIYVPEYNVAAVERSACVVEGVSRSRNTLINGNFSVYDWDSGYTCHQLGSGSIVVQLPQPYMIDSIRLLLWDCDARSYSYFVETSVDKKEWTRVADRTDQLCRSWQILTFKPLPVVFVKIVGTHNTANEVSRFLSRIVSL